MKRMHCRTAKLQVISFSSQPGGLEAEEGGVADAKGKSRKSSKGGVGGLEDGSGKGKERGNKKLLNLRQEIEQLHEKVRRWHVEGHIGGFTRCGRPCAKGR